jgi:methylmalonyl-CoA mutase
MFSLPFASTEIERRAPFVEAKLDEDRREPFFRAMSADPITPLAADFEGPDERRWRALAEAALKGAPFERLTTKSPDGVTIAPLYRAQDTRDVSAAALIQQAHAARPAYLPWDIRQACVHPDPARANEAILEDLRGGASSVLVKIDDGEGEGLPAEDL